MGAHKVARIITPIWYAKCVLGKNGAPTGAPGNVVLALAHDEDWQGVLAYDERRLRPVFVRSPPWSRGLEGADARLPRDVADDDADRCVAWCTSEHGMPATSGACARAIATVAKQASFDALKSYFTSLRWDQSPRIDRWLHVLCGADDTPYTRAVGAKWLISAVARTFAPGCKVDTMLILEGAQGILKSSLLRVLAGDEHFTDQLPDLDSKDALQHVHGPLIVEVSELDAFSRKEAASVKAFLTVQVDRFRPPFGRTVAEFPRRCVFAGTTNKRAYLQDETGARRFWPVKASRIDLALARVSREQLWAEACSRYLSGEPWWLDADGDSLAREQQDDRSEEHAWTPAIARALDEGVPVRVGFGARPGEYAIPPRAESVSVAEVLGSVLGIPEGQWTQTAQTSAARVLVQFGWERRQVRVNGVRTWRYFRPSPVVTRRSPAK